MLLILVSALALTTLAPALADMHPAATDGQRLEDQSAAVQSAYRAVYGADAEAKWIEEHNKDLHYYHRIVAVAKARIAASMDMGMGMGMDSDMDMDMDMDSDMDTDSDMDMDPTWTWIPTWTRTWTHGPGHGHGYGPAVPHRG